MTEQGLRLKWFDYSLLENGREKGRKEERKKIRKGERKGSKKERKRKKHKRNGHQEQWHQAPTIALVGKRCHPQVGLQPSDCWPLFSQRHLLWEAIFTRDSHLSEGESLASPNEKTIGPEKSGEVRAPEEQNSTSLGTLILNCSLSRLFLRQSRNLLSKSHFSSFFYRNRQESTIVLRAGILGDTTRDPRATWMTHA